MVESRCAITSVVRSCDTRSSASWISRSVWLSSAEVASSSSRIGGAFEDGAGDRDALLLAAGELQAALADLGLVAVRRHADEAVDLREPRGLLDLGVARLPAAVADVVADGVVEQHGVLRDHADRGAQRLLRHVADVLAVDQDAAAGHVVEAEQQPRDRRLAGAGRADDRDRLAGRHLEADALEDRPRRLVGEADVLEADAAGAAPRAAWRPACPRSPAGRCRMSNIVSMSIIACLISR